jgi:hypothetical protein
MNYQFYTLSPSMGITATLLDASTSTPIPRHEQSRVIQDEIDDEQQRQQKWNFLGPKAHESMR